MLRRVLANVLVCACLGTLSCGGAAPEAGESALPNPASPAAVRASPAPAARAIDDPAFAPRLENTIRESQERLIRHWRFFDNFNPLGMTLDQLKDAHKLLKSVVPEFRKEMVQVADAAEEYSAAYPDLSSAPSPVVYLTSRAWAYRFRFWTGLAVMDNTERLLQELVQSGHCTPLDLMLLGAKLETFKLSREGVLLFRRYLKAATETLHRQVAQPTGQLGIVLYDSRLLSLAWLPGSWPAPEREQMNAAIDGFLKSLSTMNNPRGVALAQIEKDLWGPSAAGNSTEPTVAMLTKVRDDFARLKGLFPVVGHDLEFLRAQVDSEIKQRH